MTPEKLRKICDSAPRVTLTLSDDEVIYIIDHWDTALHVSCRADTAMAVLYEYLRRRLYTRDDQPT